MVSKVGRVYEYLRDNLPQLKIEYGKNSRPKLRKFLVEKFDTTNDFIQIVLYDILRADGRNWQYLEQVGRVLREYYEESEKERRKFVEVWCFIYDISKRTKRFVIRLPPGDYILKRSNKRVKELESTDLLILDFIEEKRPFEYPVGIEELSRYCKERGGEKDTVKLKNAVVALWAKEYLNIVD